MKLNAVVLVAASLVVRSAHAQGEDAQGWDRSEDPAHSEVGWVKPEQEVVGPWATDLLDPRGYTRYGVTTRATFSDGRAPFSGAMAWAMEGHLQLGLTEGWAISGVLPFGLVHRPGAPTEAFIGNIGVAVSAGGIAHDGASWVVRWAAGLDVTAPTAGQPADERVVAVRSTVAAIRGTAPHLFVPRLFSVYARGHVDATYDVFTGDLELGLLPGGTVGEGGAIVLLGAAVGRVSARVTETLEPYLEAGVMSQLAGAGELAPPLWVTPGLRLHIAEAFDPAIFVSFNFVAASAVVIGVDLAALSRPKRGGAVVPDQPKEFLDF